MSAYLCSEEHIATLVNAVNGDAGDFIILVNENVRSLESRYPGRDFLEDWKREAATYRFSEKTPAVTPTQLAKLCNCYDYQACESADYKTTKAAMFVCMVLAYALQHGGKQDGREYDAAPWSL
jgi:hypothetical protein